jgi:hypothetical protein
MSQKMPDAYQVRVNYGYGMSALQQSPQQIQTRALAVVRAFVPKKVVGFEKVRLGRDSDGGYIHVDDFSGVEAALSFGISDDVSWDLDIARRNIPAHQFDHTIDKPPADNPKLFFHKKRVAASNEPVAMSLDSVVERFLAGCNRASRLISKETNGRCFMPHRLQHWQDFRRSCANFTDSSTRVIQAGPNIFWQF